MDTEFSDRAACRAGVEPCVDPICPHRKVREVTDKQLNACDELRGVRATHANFFAWDGSSITWKNLGKAVAVCNTCPVWQECLEYAAGQSEAWRNGVYGGTIGHQRIFHEGGGRPTNENGVWVHRAGVPRKPDLESALALAREKRLRALVCAERGCAGKLERDEDGFRCVTCEREYLVNEQGWPEGASRYESDRQRYYEEKENT